MDNAYKNVCKIQGGVVYYGKFEIGKLLKGKPEADWNRFAQLVKHGNRACFDFKCVFTVLADHSMAELRFEGDLAADSSLLFHWAGQRFYETGLAAILTAFAQQNGLTVSDEWELSSVEGDRPTNHCCVRSRFKLIVIPPAEKPSEWPTC